MAKTTYVLDEEGKLFTQLPGQKPIPVMVWVEEDGKRRMTDKQQTNAEGVPSWTMPVVVQRLAYGSPTAELVDVQYYSADGELPAGGAAQWM